MLKENAFLGAIETLAPASSIDVEKEPKGLPQKAQLVRVNFEEERIGYLDLSYPRAKVWAKIIAYLQARNRPVYVETDPDTRIITTLCVPEAAKVLRIQPPGEDVVYVAFQTSSARHYLRRDHPNYLDMLNALQQALDTDSTILVTSTLHKFEIIDVRPMPSSYGIDQPPSPPGPTVPDPPVSWDRAVELFNMVSALSCEPCSATNPCITYLYPYNGCWVRAHLMCYLMIDEGETPEKIWIDSSGCNLHVPTPNVPECAIDWCWHVAPTLMVEQDGGPDIKMVIDPSLCCEPVTPEQWRLIQTDTSASLTPSSWEQYGPGGGTATQAQANDDMELFRDYLNDLCDINGPPPYSCPTIRNCTLITDRSTFGEDEIAAMLTDGAPARFEVAFYVILDGFSPQELGITNLDTPETAPTIVMFPTVAGMTVPDDPDDTHFTAEYQDSDHLGCPQRLTWRYRVEFTSTDAFTFPPESPFQVTLTASIASVSDDAIIRLIRQASPYELDGSTHWLSDDLCVFQVKEGEGRFGETMEGSTPEAASDFINNVIRRLNENDTGEDTFEDVRDDQQTSQLPLYPEDIEGTRVFNYAVARVRYRSAASAAENVRVFFRLFPWETTSVEYNQATTYRRGGHGDVTIPLLGIRDDGALTTIPCFADLRHEPTPTEDMNWQRDIPNVQPEIAATGDENLAYFGCWLDINQPTQELFPSHPFPEDGPFPPTGRESILEHIRGKHQCLVAEIAFDPDPIPDEATPAMSDKLAQRNLAIVESANPGESASRRIPHTFDIRPTPATLEADELPDELMIDWGNTPSGSVANIYVPAMNASAVLDKANEMYGSHRLTRVDEHTLQCQAVGITYMPIPPGLGANLTGLLSVDLPETVVRGDAYTIVVHQVTNAQGVVLAHDPDSPPPEPLNWRRILGSFQLTIPVRAKEELLEPEARLLSVMRWIQRAIPDDDRWFAVFGRYVDQIATRVDALGGNSSEVVPSPSGNWQASKAVIRARQPWNETGIWLEAGKTYQLTATGKWTDGLITTDADGYRLWPLILFEGLRRAPEYNWFALIGTIGRTEATRFLIGSGTQYSPPHSGYLYCFANNARWFYWNNFGQINLEAREI